MREVNCCPCFLFACLSQGKNNMLSVIRDQREQDQRCANHQHLQTQFAVLTGFLGADPSFFATTTQPLAPRKLFTWASVHNHFFPINSYRFPSLCQARKLQMQPWPHLSEGWGGIPTISPCSFLIYYLRDIIPCPPPQSFWPSECCPLYSFEMIICLELQLFCLFVFACLPYSM